MDQKQIYLNDVVLRDMFGSLALELAEAKSENRKLEALNQEMMQEIIGLNNRIKTLEEALDDEERP